MESLTDELKNKIIKALNLQEVAAADIKDDEPLFGGRFPDAGGTGPGEPPALEMPQLVGDIVICPSVAARNAVEHEVTFDDEVALLVVHGVLHLLGWDHEVDAEAERMEAREQELLNRHYRLRVVK